MSKKMQLVAGLDIGNGYVKGGVSANGQPKTNIDYLSGVAIQTNSHDIKTKDSEAGLVLDDIFNQMEASFDSPAVSTHIVRLFGRRGISSGKSMEEFDVSSTTSKATQDLSSVLVLGSLAGKAVQAYFKANGSLPTEILHVEASMALALPITEYKQYRKMYADKFKDNVHVVSIYNFETTVRVEITITDVQVVAEGASAQFAITAYGTQLMDVMLSKLRERGEMLEGITSADILAASNTVGIDIGEGTVNFPVFQDGRFNSDASMSFAKGYGTVLEQARERLQGDMNMPFGSRKALADFLLKAPSPMQRGRYNKVYNVVQEEVQGFAVEVTAEFRKVISRVGSYTEVVYVYGGGSAPVMDTLYPMLISVAKSLGGEDVTYPILYLESNYSRSLNREGLFLIAQSTAAALANKPKSSK